MSKQGRYGKYGEIKRFERLRQSKTHSALASRRELRVQKQRTLGKSMPKKRAVTIRPATSPDAVFIRSLSHDQFSRYGPYEDILLEWFESGAALVFVALHRSNPVGFAMLGRPLQLMDAGPTWEIVAIAVLPHHHRKGVGNALMLAVTGAARDWGASALILHTAVENRAAQLLFRKHGFEAFQLKPNFYPEGQDALMMCRDLSPTTT
jgi:ribosomal-protein-alanine N-acetyltransferase